MRVDLSLHAYRQLMAMVASTDMEVSGFGMITPYRLVDGEYVEFKMRSFKALPDEKPYQIVFRVEDIWLLDRGSMALTEIKPERVAQFYLERQQDGTDLSKLKLWWHRHPLSSGWSLTDEEAIRETPMGNAGNPKETGWMVSIVWCTHSGWNARFDQLADPGFTLHIPLTVEGQPQTLEIASQQSVNALSAAKWYTPARASENGNSYQQTPLPGFSEYDDMWDRDERWGQDGYAYDTEIEARYAQQEKNASDAWAELFADALQEQMLSTEFHLTPEREVEMIEYFTAGVKDALKGDVDFDQRIDALISRTAWLYKVPDHMLREAVDMTWGSDDL